MRASNHHRCRRPKKGAKNDNERSLAQACWERSQISTPRSNQLHEARCRMRTSGRSSACVTNDWTFLRGDGGVEFDELRHDTTCRFQNHGHEGDVQEQRTCTCESPSPARRPPWRAPPRADNIWEHRSTCWAPPGPQSCQAVLPAPTIVWSTRRRGQSPAPGPQENTASTDTSTWPSEVCTYPGRNPQPATPRRQKTGRTREREY